MSERQKRQAQQERDEMADEMVNSSSGKLVSLYYRYTVLMCVVGTVCGPLLTLYVCPGRRCVKRRGG